jgi:hypothetical protein
MFISVKNIYSNKHSNSSINQKLRTYYTVYFSIILGIIFSFILIWFVIPDLSTQFKMFLSFGIVLFDVIVIIIFITLYNIVFKE